MSEQQPRSRLPAHYLTHRLPDGTVIDVTMSDGYSGPNGRQGCQRTSMNVAWYRVNGGDWSQSAHRTMHKLREWILLSEDLADFEEGETAS